MQIESLCPVLSRILLIEVFLISERIRIDSVQSSVFCWWIQIKTLSTHFTFFHN